VLDAGALVQVERRSPPLQELIRLARVRNVAIAIPTVVVAQVVRGGRQANLRRFLADSYLRFVTLDYATAMQVGVLLGETGTADVVDAAVVVCAREMRLCPIVTTDPQDLRKLDPRIPLIFV
jgi:predicted nucleic acid-binding protein